MIEIAPFKLKEVVDQAELKQWRDQIKKVEIENCPLEVMQFIEALAAKLPDFATVRMEKSVISGYELNLAKPRSEHVDPWGVYDLPVPFMQAADHRAAMYRIFNRRGKQGLIDFCQAKVKGTELERLLEILNVHVFKHEREEFKQVMRDIEAARQLDSI